MSDTVSYLRANRSAGFNGSIMDAVTSTASAFMIEDDNFEVINLDNSSNHSTTNATHGDYLAPDESFLEYAEFVWSPELLLRNSPGVSVIYCIAYTLVFILGIIGNSLVVAVVVRSPRMRTVTNIFIVNLALADILVLVFCLPATLLSNLFIRKYIVRMLI